MRYLAAFVICAAATACSSSTPTATVGAPDTSPELDAGDAQVDSSAVDSQAAETAAPDVAPETTPPVCTLAPMCPRVPDWPFTAAPALFCRDLTCASTSGGKPVASTPCTDPKLQISISNVGGPASGAYYFVTATSDATGSELVVTPVTTGQKSFQDGPVTPALAWGQLGPRTTTGALTIVASMVSTIDTQSYDSEVAFIGTKATAAGGTKGGWGWAFNTPGAAADVLSMYVGGQTITTQTIASDSLLTLAAGATWGMSQPNGGIAFDAWGCSTTR